MHLRPAFLAGSLVLLFAATPAIAVPLTAERLASGLTRPVFVTSPPGDPRLFIVEQRGADARGRIKIFKYGSGVQAQPFLTTDPLSTGFEQGLLGLAFAPDYATSGRFYINYTDAQGHTHIERRTVSTANPDSATAVAETLLFVRQPYSNHNGGWIGFGPDGFLYVALGDGGSGGDPQNRAQNPDSLLGKMLRLDVSPEVGYAIPADNPFVGLPGRDEVYAYGLRNPFRNSFDRATGDFIIGDVGQMLYEEVNFAPAAQGAGKGINFGWPCYEGEHVYDLGRPTPLCGSCTNRPCMQFPAFEYDHSGSRCSVTGGYVYRGSDIPDLVGTYFFADYCAGRVYTGTFVGDTLSNVVDRTAELDSTDTSSTIGSVSSFGEDSNGELYICDLSGGEIFKIVARSTVSVPHPAAYGPALSLAGAMPFSGTLRLSLALPQASRVHLAVYDLAGRQVREILDDTLPAGPHALTWDGNDQSGKSAASGVYLVRATTQYGDTSVRAVRVR